MRGIIFIFRMMRGAVKRCYKLLVYWVIKFDNTRDIDEKLKKGKCKSLSNSQKKEIRSYYKSFGFKNVSTKWHEYYIGHTGTFDKRYIPLDLFYNCIEPSLNCVKSFPGAADKNLFEVVFNNVNQPTTIVKNMNGTFLNSNGDLISYKEVINLCNNFEKFIIKPTIATSGGRGVRLIKKGEGDLDSIIMNYNTNFIIQEYFIQNKVLSSLNNTSVNTLRFCSLILNDKVHIVNRYMRIGSKGSITDNVGTGGMTIGIDELGILSEYGMNNQKKVRSTELGTKISNLQIPFFRDVENKVLELHKKIAVFKIITWDMSINEDNEPVLIEFNPLGQGLFQYEGPPFGNYTEHILKTANIKSFQF